MLCARDAAMLPLTTESECQARGHEHHTAPRLGIICIASSLLPPAPTATCAHSHHMHLPRCTTLADTPCPPSPLAATNAAEQSRLYGRHFDFNDNLVSRITRESIDALKLHFKDEMTKDDWRLVVKLKSVFQIP